MLRSATVRSVATFWSPSLTALGEAGSRDHGGASAGSGAPRFHDATAGWRRSPQGNARGPEARRRSGHYDDRRAGVGGPRAVPGVHRVPAQAVRFPNAPESGGAGDGWAVEKRYSVTGRSIGWRTVPTP